MLIGRLAIFWLICITWIVSAQYECVYEDESGKITVEVVDRDEANSCENCNCKRIKVECLFGPDSYGGFQHLNVTKIHADSCDRSKCVCSSHGSDYVEKAELRRNEAHNTVSKLKENFLDDPSNQSGKKENEKEVINDADDGEPRRIPPYNEEDASFYCSFGYDKNGGELSGLITSLTYELLCATGESICECTEIRTVTDDGDTEPEVEVEGEEEEEEEAVELAMIVLVGVSALLLICLLFIISLYCILKSSRNQDRERELQKNSAYE